MPTSRQPSATTMLSVPMWLLTALRSRLICTVPIGSPSDSATRARPSPVRSISPMKKASDGWLTALGGVTSQRPSRRTSSNRRARPRASVGRAGRSVQRRPSAVVRACSSTSVTIAPCSIGPSVQT
jgi:hypothetical protein